MAEQKKILFAVGGTGGHLFPAQALARELKMKESQLQILFGGGQLATNPFFQKQSFPFEEIASLSPYQSNPLKAALHLGKGVLQSLKLFQTFSPDLIVGFGSFYSFPVLSAARLKKIPYILVESNVLPGRVNRLFSQKALTCAIQFDEAKEYIKGETNKVKMPFWSKEHPPTELSKEKARKTYGLDEERFTLLVFGGSQGAEAINPAVASIQLDFPWQAIHLCGKNQNEKTFSSMYEKRGIPAVVKPFEEDMHMAYAAADMVICRAGAGSLGEILAFQVPAILIPWPRASEGHQMKNAKVMQELGVAQIVTEEQLSRLGEIVAIVKAQEKMMQNKLANFKFPNDLNCLVLDILEGKI